jgi:tetratricopeptide (TPR) repeat protein
LNRPTRFSRRAGLSIIGAFSLLTAGCSDRFEVAAEHAAMAEGQLAAGNLQAARENIQQAIIARDDVAGYFILLGRIELQSQKLPSAFNAFSRALDLQADNLEVLQAIAELGLQTDRLQEAEAAADRMLLLAPGSTRAKLVKGFLAIETNRLEDARRFATEILAQNPNDEGGVILSARLQALEADFDGALGTLLPAIAAVGQTEALSATLLEVYRAQGNAAGLRKTFPKVVEAAGKNSTYQLDFINFLYKTSDKAAARAEAIASISSQPNDRTALAMLGNLFLEYDATPFSAEQRDAFANSATRTSRLSVARFYFDSDQYAEAQNLLSRLLDENVTEAQALMARIALAQGKAKAADTLINIVLADDPRNPDALVARSARRLAAGQLDAAIEDANVVVSDTPQEYGGYAALAKAYLAKGSEVRARQVFERGVDFLPQSELLARQYEPVLRQIGDHGRIVSLYGDLASAKPSSARAWENFARVCREWGDSICAMTVERGLANAARSFVIDEPPGTPRSRGLFARITPEQICRSSGGICTGN